MRAIKTPAANTIVVGQPRKANLIIQGAGFEGSNLRLHVAPGTVDYATMERVTQGADRLAAADAIVIRVGNKTGSDVHVVRDGEMFSGSLMP
jgi:hypothetical protein